MEGNSRQHLPLAMAKDSPALLPSAPSSRPTALELQSAPSPRAEDISFSVALLVRRSGGHFQRGM
jgi:hypothetical protein